MSFDIVIRDRIEATINAKLQSMERQARATATSLGRIQASLDRIGRATGVSATSGRFTTLGQNVQSVDRRVNSLGQTFARTSIIANRLLSGAILVRAADNLAKTLDSFQTIQNRLTGVSSVTDSNGIKDVIASQERLNAVTNEIFGIADRARVGVEDLSKTYRRFDNALASVGASQKESLSITETVSKLLVLNGANAGEAAASMLQLSQAFNKGKLDGDEFRTTAELMPEVIDAITKRLGISKAEIYDYSRNGKITIDILRGAFNDLREGVDRDFEAMPKTIGQAFTQLYNEALRLFGLFDSSSGFTQSIVGFISYLTDNLPEIASLVQAIGVGFLAYKTVVGTLGLITAATGLLNTELKVTSLLTSVLTGGLNLLALGVGVLVGYFTYWSDEIKISSDGVVTLTDYMSALLEVMLAMVSGNTNFFDDLFTAEGAQTNFGIVLGWMDEIWETTKALSVAVVTYYETWKNLSWGDIGNILLEAMHYAGAYIQNKLVDISTFILNAVGSMIDAIIDKIIFLMQKFSVIVTTSFRGIPYIGDSVADAASATYDALEELKKLETDWGISAFLEGGRLNMKGITPTIDKLGDDFARNLQANSDKIEEAAASAYASIMVIARRNADERIAEEERVQKAMSSNPDALRGETTPLAKLATEAQGKTTSGGKKRLTIIGPLKDAEKTLSRLQEATGQFDNGVQQTNTNIEDVQRAVIDLGYAIDTINFDNVAFSSTTFRINALDNIRMVREACIDLGSVISTTQRNSWADATNAVITYSEVAIGRLKAVASASANSGVSLGLSAGGSGSPIGGSNLQGVVPFQGFASGGYTGSGGRNQVAGVVHGQEFVMPASQTERFRADLEAMRAGQNPSGGGINVTIENYSSATHTVQQVSPTEVRIIASEIVNSEASKIVARELGNPNSAMSKSVRSNLQVARRR